MRDSNAVSVTSRQLPVRKTGILSAKTIRRLEFMAIVFGFTWAVVYPLISPWRSWDFDQFLLAGAGKDLTNFYYAPWTLPFFGLLALLPYNLARVIAFTLSAAGWLLAQHTFKGNKTLFFISYPFVFSMYYGQVDGIFAASLAVMALALIRQQRITQNHQDIDWRWTLIASAGWFFACGKFYVGIPLGLGIWWLFAPDQRMRLHIVGWMAAFTLLSFALYPNWLPDLITRSQLVPPKTEYSIALWQYTGPVILLLWLPTLWVMWKRQAHLPDYRLWVATWVLTVPYLHIHGLTHLLVVPTGLIGWLVQVNYGVAAVVGTGLVQSTYLMVIPAVIYGRCLAAAARPAVQERSVQSVN